MRRRKENRNEGRNMGAEKQGKKEGERRRGNKEYGVKPYLWVDK